jgi:hypothetical protein
LTKCAIPNEKTLKKAGKSMKSVKLLAIGNSFSDDCMEHVYGILHSLGVEDIQLGNLHIPGCSLRMHCQNLRGDIPAYDYRTNDSGVWSTQTEYKLGDAISAKPWEFIFTQQFSGESGMAETYGDLDELLAYVKSKAQVNPKFGWQQTWAYAKGVDHHAYINYHENQDEMYACIVNAVQTEILPRKLQVIPSGTAIQNARLAIGDTLTRDGYHLSLGLGRYIAGLCVVKALTGLDIDGVTFAPDGVGEEERKLAIAVANAACKTPFAVTDVNKR